VVAGRSHGTPFSRNTDGQTSSHRSVPFRSSLSPTLIDWVSDYQGSLSEHYTCQGYPRFQIFSDLTQVPYISPVRAPDGPTDCACDPRLGSLLAKPLPEMAHFPTTLSAMSLGRRPKYI